MNILSPPSDVGKHPCPLNIYESVTAKRPLRTLILTTRNKLRFLAKAREVPAKEAAGLFSGVSFIDPAKEARKISGIESVNLVVGDIDDKFNQVAFDAGRAALRTAGVSAVLYETYSSTPQAPRWRVVVALDVPISPADYRRCWEGLNAMFGGILDGNAKDAARLSYLASHPPGETRKSIIIEGAA